MVAPSSDVDHLIDNVFGQLGVDSSEGKAILSTHNADINSMNARITERFPGQVSPSTTIMFCITAGAFTYSCMHNNRCNSRSKIAKVAFVTSLYLLLKAGAAAAATTSMHKHYQIRLNWTCMQAREFLSADTVEDESTLMLYPPEFLHTLEPAEMPPHKLTLKVGMPVMLLRNMNQAEGKANGTILIIRSIHSRLIEAQIVNGSNKGDIMFIPRIKLLAKQSDHMPFRLVRVQFPIKPAFAMTINKAQGQTLDRMGLYLSKPVFSHGMLYVALSRVGDADAITVMVTHPQPSGLTGTFTKNVVYKEVLH